MPLAIEEHNRKFLRQKGRLKLFCAAETTVVVSTADRLHQICQVGFTHDGSIRVDLPYLPVEQGIVGIIDYHPERGPHTYTLTDAGKFTSQLVKLSHHLSGEALFSKTGKVRSEIRRPSYPLTGPIGRLFELHAYFPGGFRDLHRLKSNRLYLDFSLPSQTEALIVRGEWRRKADIVRNTDYKSVSVGPRTIWVSRRNGAQEPVAFVGQPLEYPLQEHVVCISCMPTKIADGVTRSSLVLMGGYDLHEVPPGTDPDEPRIKGCLVAMYPSQTAEEVRATVGSIDLG